MKQKILAIDDSKPICYLLQTLLCKQYHFTAASGAYAAMQWLGKRNRPDLIIADPKLPDTCNWELIEYLTDSGLYGSIPLIVLSDLDPNETRERCRKAGVQMYFHKPFNPLELIKTVATITASQPSSCLKMSIERNVPRYQHKLV